MHCVHFVHTIQYIYGIHPFSVTFQLNLKLGGYRMARVVILVMVLVVGLWVVGQAINTKRIVERRHSNLVTMVEMAGK